MAYGLKASSCEPLKSLERLKLAEMNTTGIENIQTNIQEVKKKCTRLYFHGKHKPLYWYIMFLRWLNWIILQADMDGVFMTSWFIH